MFYDILTFGSATLDIFLKSKDFKVIETKKFVTQRGLAVSLGSKIPVDEIEFATGGGGINTAATFALQNFKVAYCGMIGDDFMGGVIKDEFKKFKISDDFLISNSKFHTNLSVILSVPHRERTILVYKDASEKLNKEDIPWTKLKSKWFYIAPLSGNLVKIFELLINFAQKNNIKVFLNPGSTQLSLPREKIKKLFSKVDILILNQEEAAKAVGVGMIKEQKIFSILDQWTKGIFIMTKGPLGVLVSDGQYVYSARSLKEKKLIDRTGAGDAFGSGFLTGFLRWSKAIKQKFGLDRIEYAIQFGSANATSCLEKFGAKNGLLKSGQSIFKWGRLKIKKTNIKKKRIF